MKKLAGVTISSKLLLKTGGFQKLMEQSDIQDKQLILRVLSMYSDTEQREKRSKIFRLPKVIADEYCPCAVQGPY